MRLRNDQPAHAGGEEGTWLMRGVWGEISYWHVLTAGEAAPLRGGPLAWYRVIGMPQAFIPFLVAERFYEGAAGYVFSPAASWPLSPCRSR